MESITWEDDCPRCGELCFHVDQGDKYIIRCFICGVFNLTSSEEISRIKRVQKKSKPINKHYEED